MQVVCKTSYGIRETWAGLYTSPIGAFLSERIIGKQTRKVSMLAISGRWKETIL